MRSSAWLRTGRPPPTAGSSRRDGPSAVPCTCKEGTSRLLANDDGRARSAEPNVAKHPPAYKGHKLGMGVTKMSQRKLTPSPPASPQRPAYRGHNLNQQKLHMLSVRENVDPPSSPREKQAPAYKGQKLAIAKYNKNCLYDGISSPRAHNPEKQFSYKGHALNEYTGGKRQGNTWAEAMVDISFARVHSLRRLNDAPKKDSSSSPRERQAPAFNGHRLGNFNQETMQIRTWADREWVIQ